MIKAVIFDMDGVIIDSISTHIKAWEKPLREQGSNFVAEDFFKEFQKYNGMNTKDFSEFFKQRYNLKVDAEILAESKHETYSKLIKTVELIPNVITLIKKLKEKGYKLAIATSEPINIATIIIKKFELEKYFKAIITIDQVTNPKPDPEMFLKAASELNIPSNQCIVIEDSPVGVTGAKNAGMKAIAITTTNKKSALQHADQVIDSFGELDLDSLQ